MLEKCREAVALLRSQVLLFCSIVFVVWLPMGIFIFFFGMERYAEQQGGALASLLSPIAAAALLQAFKKSEAGATPSLLETLRGGLASWGRLLIARFFARLFIGLATLAFIVPGILLAVRYALLDAAVVLEGSGIHAARKRSRQLGSGRGWQILGASLLYGFGALVVFLLLFLVSLSLPYRHLFAVLGSYFGALAFAGYSALVYVFYRETQHENPQQDHGMPPEPNEHRGLYLASLALVVLLSFVPAIRSSLVDWNDLPGGSMKPSLLPGDRIVVHRAAYEFRLPFTRQALMERKEPERGDLIVFQAPGEKMLLVKRIVGLPNETLELRNGELIIDGNPATYGAHSPLRFEGAGGNSRVRKESIGQSSYPILASPITSSPGDGRYEIPSSHYFVLGDNRGNSRDSRHFGPIHRAAIEGRVTTIALSLDPENTYMPRWERFFRTVP